MSDRNGARILIVEDEKILAADLEGKLRQLGYEIDAVATSGEEAVQLAQEHSPQLVLMDIRLAGAMNGVEAARQIHETKRIPIVYLTAYSDLFVRDPDQMQPTGLCIAKPFNISDLREVIDIALSSGRIH
jgi:CheY-like chemotaxis protein